MYSSTLDCFYQIIHKEGISALYAGVIPRLGRVVPGQGIIFMSFESIESALQSNFTFFQ
jgi:solute carrier family 25 (mitochondrial citrate transporter), member 1